MHRYTSSKNRRSLAEAMQFDEMHFYRDYCLYYNKAGFYLQILSIAPEIFSYDFDNSPVSLAFHQSPAK